MARVIVADDCSGPEHVAALRAIEGIDVLITAEQNVGFAANANRGLRASDGGRDVVVLNSDVEALPSWLECLQYAAYRYEDVGIVGAQLQYPDGRIQFGGTVRNRDAPEWFDHRYRFKPSDWGPAGRASPALAVTGACMYVRREVIERIGLLDERYAMAYEDVDWCLRAWQAGFGVLYFPAARLVHHESVTRGTELGERERDSQRLFWERWSDFFDARSVTAGPREGAAGGGLAEGAGAGRLRIAYVTEGTGVGGGHRDIFEHLNRLAARGHDVSLYTLDGPPDWFPLRVPVHSFADYDELAARARRARRDQGGDLVDDRRAGVAREHRARPARVLRPGHRDLLLPRPRARPPCRARLLPARVPLHDDLLVEPRAPARARPRRRADPAGDRPARRSARARTWRAARTWCSRSGAPTR